MKIKELLPGISISILISLIAWYLGNLFPIIGGPVIGLFIGLLLASLTYKSRKIYNRDAIHIEKSIAIRSCSSGIWIESFSSLQRWFNISTHYFNYYCYGTDYCLCHPQAI